MSAPWEIPPLPAHGDERADDTYKMVGHALSGWEELEYQLSHLYSHITGRPGAMTALREYGENGRIFADRIARLENAAEPFFTRHPSQEFESRFSEITHSSRKLADRRNEIAHGIVRPLQWLQSLLPEYETLRGRASEFALVPPLYTRRKLDEKHRPKYIYTANELMLFSLAFSDLSQAAALLKQQISHIHRALPPMYRKP
jgi:hypothetical protein